jgi:hypothetical protein
LRVRVYLSGNPVHDRVLVAFAEGCPKTVELVKGWKYEPSEVAVIFGVYKSKVPISWPRGEIFRQQRSKNLDVVVLETGYINRGDGDNHHYAAGLNGLNGRADFRNKNSPPDRAEKLQVNLKPWRSGEHVVLCGQVPWDASVDHSNHVEWLRFAARKILGHHVIYRPHPKGPIDPLPGCEFSTDSLMSDLQGAKSCVTYNSNSAVEAAIEGVPVFAFDEGSMALPIANTQWEEIKNPKTPDRKQWLSDLAYTQWTLDEMREGLAWRHLLR